MHFESLHGASFQENVRMRVYASMGMFEQVSLCYHQIVTSVWSTISPIMVDIISQFHNNSKNP